jgi:hypothetical protein
MIERGGPAATMDRPIGDTQMRHKRAKKCKFGVNKKTGRCLKNKRAKKRR